MPKDVHHIIEQRVAYKYAGYVLLALLVTVMLSLPMGRAVAQTGEEIGSEGGTIRHSSGAAIILGPNSVAESTELNITTAAAITLPGRLELPEGLRPLDAVYEIQQRGDQPRQARLELPIPAEVEAVDTIDLYVWDGADWHFSPSYKNQTKNIFEAEVLSLPQAMALMQREPGQPRIAVEATALEDISGDDSLLELTPRTFTLGPGGLVVIHIQENEPEEDDSIPQLPIVRNWNDYGNVYGEALAKLLTDPTARTTHAEALAALINDSNYQGIELDYRGITPDVSRDFIAFLAELRQILAADKQLAIRLPLPQATGAGQWTTGPFDWPAIGRLVDVVKIPTLPDPADPDMRSLLAWAVSQVERSKLQLLIQPGSVEWVGGTMRHISPQEALSHIGQVMAVAAPDMLSPGQEVEFTLDKLSASNGLQQNSDGGAQWFTYLDEAGQQRTIYLDNPAAAAATLALAGEFGLRGVGVQSIPEHSNPDYVLETTNALLEQSSPSEAVEYAISWRVTGAQSVLVDEATTSLSAPEYHWTAPEDGGIFKVAADVVVNQDGEGVPQGSLLVQVATPTLTPSPTPTPAPTAVPTSPPQTQAQPQPAPPPAAPPPPAVPAVNVPFGYGIQADPRGDSPANIGHIAALGFNWVKFQMAWKDVESQPNDFSWAMWDQIVDMYHNNGIRILLSIPKAPDWARPPGDDRSVEGPPQDPNLYAAFVARVADRYRGRVQAIEVWNEQNLWYEAGGAGRINAANYVQLLQLSYRAIKATNPEMIVVSGALTPAGNVGEFAVDDVVYLQQMYANGAKGYFDALGAHPSGYNCPAGGDWRTVVDPTALNFRGTFDNRHHSWCFKGTMESYREVMVANGDGHKAIVPTEFGWAVSGNPHPGYEYAKDNTPEEQAQWIVEAYQLAKSWGWVGPMFLWNLDYGVTAAGTELASFSILNTPAFGALAGMPK